MSKPPARSLPDNGVTLADARAILAALARVRATVHHARATGATLTPDDIDTAIAGPHPVTLAVDIGAVCALTPIRSLGAADLLGVAQFNTWMASKALLTERARAIGLEQRVSELEAERDHAHRAGRNAAAQAIREHAELLAPHRPDEPSSDLCRHLLMAARVAMPEPTGAELAAAITTSPTT